jgi:hypothetical protein
MQVERAGHDHGINILEIEQAAVIVKRLYSWGHLPGFVAPPRISVSDGHQLGIGKWKHLLEKFLSPSANTDHAYTDPVIGAERPRGWLDEYCCRSYGCLLDKIAPSNSMICHCYAPPC